MVYLLGLAAAVMIAVGFVLQQHAAEPKCNGNEVKGNLEQARGKSRTGAEGSTGNCSRLPIIRAHQEERDGYQRQWWFCADRLIRGDR